MPDKIEKLEKDVILQGDDAIDVQTDIDDINRVSNGRTFDYGLWDDDITSAYDYDYCRDLLDNI